MPVQPVVRGGRLVYVVEPATIETRADALGAEVPRGDVDPHLVEDVERTVRMASRTLGLDPQPRLRWLPADTRSKRGVTWPEAVGEIWVVIQEPAATENTAKHELRHCWQLQPDKARWLLPELKTMEQREADADRFAAAWSIADVPPIVDQAAARREWERRWGPIHEATAREFAQRADSRRSPMLRASPALGRQFSAPGPIRQERKVNGATEIGCEQCGEWVKLNVTHRCPAGRRQSSAAGYAVKVGR